MPLRSLEETIEEMLAHEPRYHREAYFFLREALDYTQKAISKANKGRSRHVTGQELLAGIRAYALDAYGPMALTLLQEWGVRCCEDFGELVFTMVEHGVLDKTERDSRADFQGGYDFEETFRKPFLPLRRAVPVACEGGAREGGEVGEGKTEEPLL